MVATADRVAFYRGGSKTELRWPILQVDGLDGNSGQGSGDVYNGDWMRMRNANGWVSVYSGVAAAGSNMVNQWGNDRGGSWLPRYSTAQGRYFRDGGVSRDYDELEIPTYMVLDASTRVFRYADGSIQPVFIGSQAHLHRARTPWRPVDPDMPNRDNNGVLEETWNENAQPTNQWILTAEGATRMLKAWLERSGGSNLFAIGDTALEGQFIGQDADGPTGMIGTWELPADAFGVGDVRDPIRGSFGAEYAP